MRTAGWLFALTFALSSISHAASITLSTVSSDATPASQLDAALEFLVGDFDPANPGEELQLTLSNPAAPLGDALFSINEVFWNASPLVTALTLLTATHSVAGDVFAAWEPVEATEMVDGFGIFGFGVTDGVGQINPAVAEPGENVVFVLSIAGTGPFVDTQFVTMNSMGYVAGAKFVNGPDDPEAPGQEDSAFGAAVPEPGSAALLALSAGLVLASRRRA